jgi:hypothetical protein
MRCHTEADAGEEDANEKRSAAILERSAIGHGFGGLLGTVSA